MAKLRNTSAMAAVLLLIFCASGAQAMNSEQVLRALAIGTLVREESGQINDFINSVSANRNMPSDSATRVVPAISVGDKGYIGAAQIIGPEDAVFRTDSVFQYQDSFDYGRYRINLMFPNQGLNPFSFNRVPGVGLSALIDVAMDGGAPGLVSGGIYTDDLTRAAAIGAAVVYESDAINSFINSIYGQRNIGMESYYATKVVPRLSVGEHAYIGAVQVVGPPEDVWRVQAVFEYDDIFDGGRFRVSVVVPGDSLDPFNFRRVQGVGISAVIDTSIADLQPDNRYPYFVWYRTRRDNGMDRYPHHWNRNGHHYDDYNHTTHRYGYPPYGGHREDGAPAPRHDDRGGHNGNGGPSGGHSGAPDNHGGSGGGHNGGPGNNGGGNKGKNEGGGMGNSTPAPAPDSGKSNGGGNPPHKYGGTIDPGNSGGNQGNKDSGSGKGGKNSGGSSGKDNGGKSGGKDSGGNSGKDSGSQKSKDGGGKTGHSEKSGKH